MGKPPSSGGSLLFGPFTKVLFHLLGKDAQGFKQGWEAGVALIRRENVAHRKRQEERKGKGGGSQMFSLLIGKCILVSGRGRALSLSSARLEQ